jgi:hypothetical protein
LLSRRRFAVGETRGNSLWVHIAQIVSCTNDLPARLSLIFRVLPAALFAFIEPSVGHLCVFVELLKIFRLTACNALFHEETILQKELKWSKRQIVVCNLQIHLADGLGGHAVSVILVADRQDVFEVEVVTALGDLKQAVLAWRALEDLGERGMPTEQQICAEGLPGNLDRGERLPGLFTRHFVLDLEDVGGDLIAGNI